MTSNLVGKQVSSSIGYTPYITGTIVAEPAMDKNANWYVVVRIGSRLESFDIYGLIIQDDDNE
jgi:hypothetical protein